eukprot:5508648-Karenia_brevis.AAC.1
MPLKAPPDPPRTHPGATPEPPKRWPLGGQVGPKSGQVGPKLAQLGSRWPTKLSFDMLSRVVFLFFII